MSVCMIADFSAAYAWSRKLTLVLIGARASGVAGATALKTEATSVPSSSVPAPANTRRRIRVRRIADDPVLGLLYTRCQRSVYDAGQARRRSDIRLRGRRARSAKRPVAAARSPCGRRKRRVLRDQAAARCCAAAEAALPPRAGLACRAIVVATSSAMKSASYAVRRCGWYVVT